ncbi:ribonuclease III [Haliangium ochraceum]|uniref:ribonuclease III n=1 Tax=Haliangium ochraceum TaxID=80816 RepID=UPI00019BB1BE|nr:ribonuclease III [Haliangium ochraceum]
MSNRRDNNSGPSEAPAQELARADTDAGRRAASEAGKHAIDLSGLEDILGHRFRKRALLEAAVTHRSFANEQAVPCTDNERLEFLGDAVLDLAVGHMLMDVHPDLSEGRLSVTRAQIVSEKGLSEIAYGLGLGTYLRLGKGERRSGGQNKASILADSLEAVIAAVYLDGGFDAAWKLVARLFARTLEEVEISGFYDHKTRLQELAQARLKSTPAYRVVDETGPDHAKLFEVVAEIDGREWGRAIGSSKKRAEQMAAANAAFLLSGANLEAMGLVDNEAE